MWKKEREALRDAVGWGMSVIETQACITFHAPFLQCARESWNALLTLVRVWMLWEIQKRKRLGIEWSGLLVPVGPFLKT